MMPDGLEGAKTADMGARSAFPDKRTEILDIFGSGDRVVAQVGMTGTNDGGLPWFGIPQTGVVPRRRGGGLPAVGQVTGYAASFRDRQRSWYTRVRRDDQPEQEPWEVLG